MVKHMPRRALLVVNPNATSTTRATRLVLERALRSALDLEVAETSIRGEGAALARKSQHDLIVVLGGDGTVNDVTTGLIDFASARSRGPALAVVPGGSTNVFARALGMPSDPVEATARLIWLIDANRQRTISIGGLTVGSASERTFLFSAGMGVDGQTVAAIEKRRGPAGISPMRYAFASLSTLSKSRPRLEISVDGERLHAAVAIATTNPIWTYFGNKPLRLTPAASFDTGLGLFTLDEMKRVPGALLSLARTGYAEGAGTRRWSQVERIEITSLTPLPVQADGEALRMASGIRLRTLPQALTVLA